MTLDQARELVRGQELLHRPSGMKVGYLTVHEANRRLGTPACVEVLMASGTQMTFAAQNLDVAT